MNKSNTTYLDLITISHMEGNLVSMLLLQKCDKEDKDGTGHSNSYTNNLHTTYKLEPHRLL